MVEKIVLDNGVTVVLEEIPFVRSIAFGIWVKNGSRNETKKENGMSHFIEHMLFKGTKTRGPKRIADEMDAIGGQLNAYTSREYTCYYTRVLDSHFDIALGILSDMFFNSNFDEEEIEKEKNVIYEEISMYEDTPEDLVHDALQAKAYAGDSLGYPILGTKTGISRFKRVDFINYMRKNYRPDNTVIALAGNFKIPEIIKKIEKAFSNYSCDAHIPGSFNASYKSAVSLKEKKIEQLHMSIAFPGIDMNSDYSYVLSVFNTLFGGGMSSRLFQSVREDKGLVYSIYSYSQSYSDTGIYSIYAALGQQQLADAFALIIDEIKTMLDNGIAEDQIQRTKEQLKSNYMLSLESSSSRMSGMGRSQLLLNRVLSPDELIGKVEAVTASDINALMQSIFRFEEMSVSIVGRTKNINAEELVNGQR